MSVTHRFLTPPEVIPQEKGTDVSVVLVYELCCLIASSGAVMSERLHGCSNASTLFWFVRKVWYLVRGVRFTFADQAQLTFYLAAVAMSS